MSAWNLHFWTCHQDLGISTRAVSTPTQNSRLLGGRREHRQVTSRVSLPMSPGEDGEEASGRLRFFDGGTLTVVPESV